MYYRFFFVLKYVPTNDSGLLLTIYVTNLVSLLNGLSYGLKILYRELLTAWGVMVNKSQELKVLKGQRYLSQVFKSHKAVVKIGSNTNFGHNEYVNLV